MKIIGKQKFSSPQTARPGHFDKVYVVFGDARSKFTAYSESVK